MLDIGQRPGEFRGDGSTIKGVVDGLKYNKLIIYSIDTTNLDLGVANSNKRLGIVPFKRWRVVALGMMWIEGSTANEDPIVEFGNFGDDNAYGTMTSAITGGEKFCLNDHQKYDPLDLLAPEVIAETSATLAITWTEGVKFNVWQTVSESLKTIEAAVAGMTSGQVKPYMIIEVDKGGRW